MRDKLVAQHKAPVHTAAQLTGGGSVAMRSTSRTQLMLVVVAFFVTRPPALDKLKLPSQARSGQAATKIQKKPRFPIDELPYIAFSTDGKALRYATRLLYLGRIETGTGEVKESKEAQGHPVMSLAMSSDGSEFASATGGKSAKLFRRKGADGKPLGTFRRTGGHILSLAYSADKRWLAVGSGLGVTELYDLKHQKRVTTLEDNRSKGTIDAIAVSSKGNVIVTGNQNGEIVIWDVGKQTSSFRAPPKKRKDGTTQKIETVAISPDNTMVAYSTTSAYLTVMAMKTGKQLFQVQLDSTALSIDFSPDARLVGVGTIQGECQLFRADSGKLLSSFPKQNGAIGALCFSPDRRHLATATWNGTIRLWHINTKKQVWEARTAASR